MTDLLTAVACVVIGGATLGIIGYTVYDFFRLTRQENEHLNRKCPHGLDWDDCPDCRH